jgi:hypothetical protein
MRDAHEWGTRLYLLISFSSGPFGAQYVNERWIPF